MINASQVLVVVSVLVVVLKEPFHLTGAPGLIQNPVVVLGLWLLPVTVPQLPKSHFFCFYNSPKIIIIIKICKKKKKSGELRMSGKMYRNKLADWCKRWRPCWEKTKRRDKLLPLLPTPPKKRSTASLWQHWPQSPSTGTEIKAIWPLVRIFSLSGVSHQERAEPFFFFLVGNGSAPASSTSEGSAEGSHSDVSQKNVRLLRLDWTKKKLWISCWKNAENLRVFFFFFFHFTWKKQQQQLVGQDSVCVVWKAPVRRSCPVQNTVGLPQRCAALC